VTARDGGSENFNGSDTIKVCSYNIHKGFCAANRKYLLERLRQAIRIVHADIFFLQEVVGENHRMARRVSDWNLEAQFEYLADSVWQHYSYGKNAVYDHGHHGNAILSKYPIEQWENINLSQKVPFSHRGALHSVVTNANSGSKLHLFCVHLGLISRERKLQAHLLIDAVNKLTGENDAVVIAGDFNDWNHRITPVLERELGVREIHCTRQRSTFNFPRSYKHFKSNISPPTFPARFPMLSVDRIYYRNLNLENSKVLKGEPWNSLSDHCALFAEFSFPASN